MASQARFRMLAVADTGGAALEFPESLYQGSNPGVRLLLFLEECCFISYGVPEDQIGSDAQHVISEIGPGEDAFPRITSLGPLLLIVLQFGIETPLRGPGGPTILLCRGVYTVVTDLRTIRWGVGGLRGGRLIGWCKGLGVRVHRRIGVGVRILRCGVGGGLEILGIFQS